MTDADVAAYRLLFMRANRLDHWELIEADDFASAVQKAAERGSEDVVELWSDKGKVGVFWPAGRHHGSR